MRYLRGPTPGYARAICLCACIALPACSQEPRTDPSPVATPSPPPARRDILGKKLAQKKVLYSQHNEELIIRDFFQDRRAGFFLDVGCAWPKKYNNTYFLESALGWSGIGIDALPEYAPAWKSERRNSRFFNYMVTDHSGSIEKFFRAAELPGISSVAPRKAFSRKKVKYEEIRVPTITLTKLLEDAGVERIDLLSMDIEGHEPTALAGFDIDRFRPELVCIEVYHAGQEKLRTYFADHGYERIERYVQYDGANQYFTPKTTALAAGPGR
jgi:FkbM family methyltransferase